MSSPRSLKVNKDLLEKIKKIVDGRYRYIMLGVLGNKALSDKDKKILEAAGIDYRNKESLVSLIYHHNYHNNPADPKSPKNLAAIKVSLKGKKLKDSTILGTLNDSFKELTEKMQADTEARVLGLVRDSFRKIEMQKMSDKSIDVAQLFKESASTIKQRLRDASASGSRDWQRVVLTEMSNAIGYGSTEKILDDNKDTSPSEIIVYRVTVNDNVTCFSESEEILMGDGSYKVLKDVEVGDKIQSGNRMKDRNPGSKAKVLNKIIQEQEVFRYEFEDGTLIEATKEHPVLVKSANFLGFLTLEELEKSLIPFIVPKWEDLTIGEKSSLSRIPKWVNELDESFVDMHSFWKTHGTEIIKDINNIKNKKQAKLVWNKWNLPKLTWDRRFSDMIKLCGVDCKSLIKAHNKDNRHNNKYLEKASKEKQAILQRNKDYIISEAKGKQSFKRIEINND